MWYCYGLYVKIQDANFKAQLKSTERRPMGFMTDAEMERRLNEFKDSRKFIKHLRLDCGDKRTNATPRHYLLTTVC